MLELSKEFLLKHSQKTRSEKDKEIATKLLEDASKLNMMESIDIQVLVQGRDEEEVENNQKILKKSLIELLDSKISKTDKNCFSTKHVSNRIFFRINHITVDFAATKDHSIKIPLCVYITSFIDFLQKHGSESKKIIREKNRKVDTEVLGYDMIITP